MTCAYIIACACIHRYLYIERCQILNRYLSRISRKVSAVLNTKYIYIVSHNSSREHRVLTKFRHLTRFLTSTLTSFHVLPSCLISSRIVLRHVVRGLVPWGFHFRAAFAMSPGGRRNVWPSILNG